MTSPAMPSGTSNINQDPRYRTTRSGRRRGGGNDILQASWLDRGANDAIVSAAFAAAPKDVRRKLGGQRDFSVYAHTGSDFPIDFYNQTISSYVERERPPASLVQTVQVPAAAPAAPAAADPAAEAEAAKVAKDLETDRVKQRRAGPATLISGPFGIIDQAAVRRRTLLGGNTGLGAGGM